jgi:glycosyltransferase involved in cell wall biosynthesis
MITKLGILSHILPPSPSGQSVVLYRLLHGLNEKELVLISAKDYTDIRNESSATDRLKAKYVCLNGVHQLPLLWRRPLRGIGTAVNALWTTYIRSREIRKILIREKCDALVGCTGDPYDLPAGCIASRECGVPYIPYIFDDFVYQWTGFFRILARVFEPFVINGSTSVIVPNEFMQARYRRRYGVRSAVIYNPCGLKGVEIDLSKRYPVQRHQRRIVYTGSVYHAHYDAFKNLTDALSKLDHLDVKLHVYTSQTESELKENGIFGKSVVYHKHISSSAVVGELEKADILFLPLAFHSRIPEVIRTSSPGKMGEYLAVGRPILVHAPGDSFLSWYFRQNSCGMVVSENDPTLLKDAIVQILTDEAVASGMGEKARKVAYRDFSMDKMQERFRDVLDEGAN